MFLFGNVRTSLRIVELVVSSVNGTLLFGVYNVVADINFHRCFVYDNRSIFCLSNVRK